MRIHIIAKPSARENKIEVVDATTLRVAVQEPPIQGRANAAIITLVAEYFGVARGKVTIVSGYTSRNKIIEVEGVNEITCGE